MKLEGYMYKSGDCKQYLLWQDQVTLIITSLNIKKYNNKVNLIKQLIEGDLRHKFSTAKSLTEKQDNKLAKVHEAAMAEDEQFVHTMQQVTKSVFSKKALMLQKFYILHYMYKSKEMKTEGYCS